MACHCSCAAVRSAHRVSAVPQWGGRLHIEIEYREPASLPDRYPQQPHSAFMDDVVESYLPAIGGLESLQPCNRFVAHSLSPQ